MASIAISTWDGGGNLPVIRTLAERLEQRGHSVAVQVGAGLPPLLDADVLLLDHMTSNDGLAAALDSGKPAAVLVHTMWSFVPSFEGGFAPAGYLDLLARFDRALVLGVEALDAPTTVVPANVRWVGPPVAPEGPDAGWLPPARSLAVVTLCSFDLGDAPVLQRVLDAVASLPIDVVATAGAHIDRRALRVPSNVEVRGFTRHAALLPHADVFVGHGGLGGIMAAGAFGVPMVLLPLDIDQPLNAARVAAYGAGRSLPKDADPATIAAAIEAVRTGTAERSRAIDLANAIAGYGDAAVTEIESLLR
jgi:hypothetical protein